MGSTTSKFSVFFFVLLNYIGSSLREFFLIYNLTFGGLSIQFDEHISKKNMLTQPPTSQGEVK